MVACGGLFIGRLAPTPGVQALIHLQSGAHAARSGFALVVCGLFVLTTGWLALGEQVRGSTDGVRRVVRATAVWAAPLLLAPPLFSDDVWSYVAEGNLVATGRSPYVSTPLDLSGPIVEAVNAKWVGVHAPYGPLPLAWGGAVSHLSMNPWFGLYGFRLLALVGLAAMMLCVPRVARLAGRDPASATWLAVASPFTLAHGIAGAHLDLVMAGLLCWALHRAVHGRWVTGALLVGVAAAVKAPAMLVGAGIVLASLPPGVRDLRIRARRGVEVLALSTSSLLGLGVVTGLGTGWLSGLMTPLEHLSTLSLSTQIGLLLGALSGARLVAPLQVVGTLLLGALTLLTVLARPSGSAPAVVSATAGVMSASVLLSPVVHYWYFLWCLPFLACAALPSRAARVAFSMTLMLGLLAPVDLSHHIPDASTIMLGGVSAAFLAALGLPLAERSRRHR